MAEDLVTRILQAATLRLVVEATRVTAPRPGLRRGREAKEGPSVGSGQGPSSGSGQGLPPLGRLGVPPFFQASPLAVRRQGSPSQEGPWAGWGQGPSAGSGQGLTGAEEGASVPSETPLPPYIRGWMRQELRAYREAQRRKWRNWLAAVQR